jgi:hypothetical protein
MPYMRDLLDLERCPHCGVDRPTLSKLAEARTQDFMGEEDRFWRTYKCSRCGGVVTAVSYFGYGQSVDETYPADPEVDSSIPTRPREYLQQALNSLAAPVGAVMLAASAVDAMLKEKGYVDGSLYARIDKAASEHVITSEMAQWAHDVRLDANDQRHADQSATLPTLADAKRSIEFAMAFAQFLFVLPARVQRGLKAAKGKS